MDLHLIAVKQEPTSFELQNGKDVVEYRLYFKDIPSADLQLKEVERFPKEDNDGNTGELIVRESQAVPGIIDFNLSMKFPDDVRSWWSSRVSDVSTYAGYECVDIQIGNIQYAMNVREAIKWVPEGFVLAEVDVKYFQGERMFMIIAKTLLRKNKKYCKEVHIGDDGSVQVWN